MSGWPGSRRAISRNTVRPPTPLSKMPIGLFVVRSSLSDPPEERRTDNEELFGGFRDTRTTLPLDVVLLDFLIQIRSGRIDRLGRLRHVPAVLAQLGQDECLLRLVLERLQRRQMHRAADDLRRRA